MIERTAFIAALALALAAPAAIPARAQSVAVSDIPLSTTPIPTAADMAWPGGTMTLEVDASDVSHGIYRVTQTINVEEQS